MVAKAIDALSAPAQGTFRCPAGTPCEATLETPDGHDWLLSVSAKGYWAFPPEVQPGGVVGLWPSGSLRGELHADGGAVLPEEITVKLAPAVGDVVASGLPPDAVVACPVSESRFRCEVPAGVFDLRLRAKGHVSIYRWAQRVAPDAPVELGRLELRKGASLVGKVVSNERDTPRPGACIVRLEAPTGPDRQGEAKAGAAKATVDARGFFQIEAIPPGSWVVVAEQAGFAAARRLVKVVEGMEANLNEPLVLARPARLSVTLTPPVDPEGKAWQVELLEKMPVRMEVLGTSSASLAGFWSRGGLSSGLGLLMQVRTASGHVWWSDANVFEVRGPVHERVVDLGRENVRGTVRLGGKPLAARVAFGAPEENISIVLEADAEGVLAGALPRLGTWHVVVTSDSPTIRRKAEVEVRRDADGSGRLEILLEDRALAGEIVDENGKRVERAILTITASSRRESSQEHVKGGTFRLTGFDPGRYLLSAEGPGRISETVPAEIAPDGSSSFVALVARAKAVVKLRLVGEGGTPIVGGRVEIVQTTRFPGVTAMQRFTDSSGRVEFFTHPDIAQQCFIASPAGRATRIFSVPPGPEEQEIPVPALGGTLRLQATGLVEGEAPLLWQGGCFASSGLLKLIVGGDGTTFPAMASGNYRFCRHALEVPNQAPVCTEGFLAPGAALTLEVTGAAR